MDEFPNPPTPPKLKKNNSTIRPRLTLTKNRPTSAVLHSNLLKLKLPSYLSLYNVISTKISRAALLTPSEISQIKSQIAKLHDAVRNWESAGGGKIIEENSETNSPSLSSIATNSLSSKSKSSSSLQKDPDAQILENLYQNIVDAHQPLLDIIQSHRINFTDDSAREWSVEEEIRRFGIRGKYLRILKDYNNRKGDKISLMHDEFIESTAAGFDVDSKSSEKEDDTKLPEFVKWILSRQSEWEKNPSAIIKEFLQQHYHDILKFVGSQRNFFDKAVSDNENEVTNDDHLQTALQDWIYRYARTFLEPTPTKFDYLNFLEVCDTGHQSEHIKCPPWTIISERVTKTLEKEFGTDQATLSAWIESARMVLDTPESTLITSSIENGIPLHIRVRESAIVLYVCDPRRLESLMGIDPVYLVSNIRCAVVSDKSLIAKAFELASRVVKNFMTEVLPAKYQSSSL
ncbi:hypothetical protein HK098_006342 [Nowakowskiella sp. JEL0407]|nr:hypothetical protein HK098_006342 [Nowakowskiella sp. JEL0407]